MTMKSPRPNRLAARLALGIALGAALGLAGCLTPRVKPAPSKAVAEARAHRATPAPVVCPEPASPLSVGFGFGDAALGELTAQAMDQAGRTLACHPQLTALIVGQADGHGTEADRKALAQGRARAVAQALESRGVAAARLSVQVEGTAPAGDAGRMVILAEGRRW